MTDFAESTKTASTDIAHGVDQFPAADLQTLRNDLLQTNVDSFQATQIVVSFLSGRGYGISAEEARGLATHMESSNFSMEGLRAEFERVARAS